MQKDFTVDIPDEIWVDSWENSATATYTYDGPETIYVLIDGLAIRNVSTNELTPSTGEHVVAVNATNYTSIARILQEIHLGLSHVHTHEDVTNPDGSTYQKISNPILKDYFELVYNGKVVGADAELGFSLQPLYKDQKTFSLIEAERRRDFVKKYTDIYDFDGDLASTVNNFMSSIESNITALTGQYPWKYVNPPSNVTLTKIPVSLTVAFKDLPLED